MHYAPGSGLLLGSGSSWLLLADQPDEQVIDRLWRALSEQGVDQALAVLETAYAGNVPAVAAWDGRTAQTRGLGRVDTGGTTELSVGLDADGPWFPLDGGVVAGAGARLRGPASSGTGLIDGIPPEIAASRGPDVPRRFTDSAERAAVTGPAPVVTGPAPTHTVRRASPVADHDGRTTRREAPSTGGVDHLRQPTHETVLAVECPHGHLTQAYVDHCRVCGVAVPPQEPRRVPRPRLGGLRLPSGELVALDRSVVLGRRPAPVDQQGEWPHLVTVPPEATYVSRQHVEITLDGWHVVARDLGSRGGTTLLVPGRAPEQMRAQESHVLEPGHGLDLADEFLVVYEVDA